MDEDLINNIESLKALTEETIQSSKRLDMMLRIYLTDEEIEEVANLRKKQQENMQRIIDISNYITHGSSDKSAEYPIDMVMLEMHACRTIIDNIESLIINIYEKAKPRLFDI